MKQTSEPAVQPRRNLLSALWVWAVGLLAAPRLLASSQTNPQATTCEDKYELTLLVGRLCIDQDFRGEFFKSADAAKAKALLKKGSMPASPGLEKKMEKILAAHKSPGNPVEEACYSVESALTMARVPTFPCNPWPC